jgi:hypothetical protein
VICTVEAHFKKQAVNLLTDIIILESNGFARFMLSWINKSGFSECHLPVFLCVCLPELLQSFFSFGCDSSVYISVSCGEGFSK